MMALHNLTLIYSLFSGLIHSVFLKNLISYGSIFQPETKWKGMPWILIYCRHSLIDVLRGPFPRDKRLFQKLNVKTLHMNMEWINILTLPSNMENSFPVICRLCPVEFKFNMKALAPLIVKLFHHIFSSRSVFRNGLIWNTSIRYAAYGSIRYAAYHFCLLGQKNEFLLKTFFW